MTQVSQLQSLNQRIDELDKECAELQTRRDSLALDFSQGNRTAQKQCEQLDVQYENAWKERGLLVAALGQLEQLAESEQQEILAKAEQEHKAKAAAVAANICSLNEQVDAQLVVLRELLAARSDQLNQLQSMRVVDGMYLNRMGKDLISNAFASHGLAKFVNLHAGAPNSIRPISASNGFFRDIGKPPPVERVKASEDA